MLSFPFPPILPATVIFTFVEDVGVAVVVILVGAEGQVPEDNVRDDPDPLLIS